MCAEMRECKLFMLCVNVSKCMLFVCVCVCVCVYCARVLGVTQ